MATTEEVAKSEMICPFISQPGQRQHCVASICMAWRWDSYTPTAKPADTIEPGAPPGSARTGHCGIIGAL